MNTRTLRTVLAVVLIGLLAACGDDDDTATPTTTTHPEPELTATVDWRARTVEVVGLEGYEITFCEGEAPFLCVSRDGKGIGGIELASYPAGGVALEDGIDAWVADHVRTLAEDRRAGCDPDYELTADETASVPFAGLDGYRYGYTGRIDGRPVERVIGVGVVDDGDLHLLVLNALADDGCMGREGELPLDAAEDLTPMIGALAAGTVELPSVTAPPPTDGEASGWLRGRSPDGLIELDLATMLSGQEAIDAAREDGKLPPDGQLPNDFYIDDDDDAVTGMPASAALAVALYDCSGGCELRPVDAQAFLRGEVDAYGGEEPLVSVELRDAKVISIEEIYVP